MRSDHKKKFFICVLQYLFIKKEKWVFFPDAIQLILQYSWTWTYKGLFAHVSKRSLHLIVNKLCTVHLISKKPLWGFSNQHNFMAWFAEFAEAKESVHSHCACLKIHILILEMYNLFWDKCCLYICTRVLFMNYPY